MNLDPVRPLAVSASELADYRHKFKLLEEGQAKHTEDLTKAWGYIMADEAAEDVAHRAINERWGGNRVSAHCARI